MADLAPALPGQGEPDHLLAQRLRTHYYWSALLHDQAIDISVRDGRVTLTGTVDTWLDRKHATAEAYACGATSVNNHLRLQPPTAGEARGE